jgi:2-amino-4-hydroxy-6-hydroxymethyldihydropteridine diphosphokinase
MKHRAYVGLGCNLGDRERNLREAIESISRLPDTHVIATSSIYASAPVGVTTSQPDYYNAVAGLETDLSPRELLEALQRVETAAGRVREPGIRNAPRTLDLDILLYDERMIDEHGLHVPHPRMHERAFVLLPLDEIAPGADIPGHGSVHELLPRVADQPVRRLSTLSGRQKGD